MVPAAIEGPNGLFPARDARGPGARDGQEKERSLYDSRFEHDACGVGFVADLRAAGGHEVVASALRVLCNLEHRGAAGADPDTGDGAGILTQLPDTFFRAVTGFGLPAAGSYAAGLAFLPTARPNGSVPSPRSPPLPPTRA
jgi:glutamate synthase (NADPH/NADH) large chain